MIKYLLFFFYFIYIIFFLHQAMTQERRRYGFVLERQCSLAKHWLAYHTAGATAYNSGLEEWLEVSRTREFLPPNVEAMFVSRMRVSSFLFSTIMF